jgi:hypothetical protein
MGEMLQLLTHIFKKIAEEKLSLHYKTPEINLDHIKKLTTSFGMIQFFKISINQI